MDYIDRTLPLTMLCPDNKAFRRVVFGSLQGTNLIKLHIFAGLLFQDVIANQTQITSVSGVTLGVETRGPKNESVYVGGAYIYKPDILARNGVYHMIDRVISLSYPTSPPSTSPAPTITPEPTKWQPPTTAPVLGQQMVDRVPILLPPVPFVHNQPNPYAVPSSPTSAPSAAPGRHVTLTTKILVLTLSAILPFSF